jgi:signal transduction histidine kinase
MKFLDIRARMLFAALLPVILVAALLATVFLSERYSDLDEAHQQQVQALTRQLAGASEYGLFSGNIGSLQAIASRTIQEPDVRSVLILDARGERLAGTGQMETDPIPRLGPGLSTWMDTQSGLEMVAQAVVPAPVPLDDFLDVSDATVVPPPAALGHVVLGFSRSSVIARSQDMLVAGLLVTLGGLVFGVVLALRIGRGVIEPVINVSNVIARIGRGDLNARLDVTPNDPLRELQKGLNLMAERLQRGREELEQRVAQATAELRARTDEAETATRAKSRFLAAASHDLRQPIHALGMFVARLAQLPLDAETRTLTAHLEASVQALQDLLDALLDISRLDADAVKVQRQAVSLDALFDQLRGTLLPIALDKGLRLGFRYSQLSVWSDPSLLHRILLNLVSNGLRYTDSGGVLVGCRRSRGGSHVWIEVWDTGVGIAPEHQAHIFREFYQVGNPERDRNKGLGLGLHIVERTTRLLGHELEVKSVSGRGSRFRLEMPLATPNVPATPVPAVDAHTDDVRGARILVVEDDVQSAQALAGLLTSWGCEVKVVEGRLAAQEVIQGTGQGEPWLPTVLISDFRLRKGETGIETLEQLQRCLPAPVPECLMSGDTDPELIQACLARDLPLLHKPVRPAKLRALLRHMLRAPEKDKPAA